MLKLKTVVVLIAIKLFANINYRLTLMNDKNKVICRYSTENILRDSDLTLRRLNINRHPETSNLLPGHVLIRPAKSMLKSSVNYPRDEKKLVYGNLENLGITYDKTPYRILYSGTRKGNNLIEILLKTIQKNRTKKRNIIESSSIIIFPPIYKTQYKPPTENNIPIKLYVPKRLGYQQNGNYVTSREHKQIANKLSDMRNKEKKIENIINNRAQIISKNIPKEETLDERTKRIQDILNRYIPIANGIPVYENTDENLKKLNSDFNNLLPIIKTKLSGEEKAKYIQNLLYNQASVKEDENNAIEILDEYSSEENSNEGFWQPGLRRMKSSKKKKRNRDSKYMSKDNSKSSESDSSDYDKNPGNPFTVHRNKYKKNWLWKHEMDGDHMNINPMAPQFGNLGPTGSQLFFARKWWYYNQDDYKPLD